MQRIQQYLTRLLLAPPMTNPIGGPKRFVGLPTIIQGSTTTKGMEELNN
jgi:hypothetical protein